MPALRTQGIVIICFKDLFRQAADDRTAMENDILVGSIQFFADCIEFEPHLKDLIRYCLDAGVRPNGNMHIWLG